MKREADPAEEKEAKRPWASPTRGGDIKREAGSGDEKEANRPRATAGRPQSVSADDFDKHARLHRCKSCDKCIYAASRATWEAAAQLPGGIGTWFQPQPVADNEWWLGCGICNKSTSPRRTRKL